MTTPTVLGIDPGCREFGFACFRGDWLEDQNVKSLRRTKSKLDRIAILQRVFTRLVSEKIPTALALEKSNVVRVNANLTLLRAIQTMKAIAKRHGVPVYEFAPSTIKKVVTGDGNATKRMVARVICSQYPELKVYLAHTRQWQERYNLNRFDAIGVGLTYLKFQKEKQLKTYEAS